MGSNFYISFGIWMVIVPMLGIPGVWKNWIIAVSGIILICISLGPVLVKRLKPKGRPKKKITKQDAVFGAEQNTELKFNPEKTEEKQEESV